MPGSWPQNDEQRTKHGKRADRNFLMINYAPLSSTYGLGAARGGTGGQEAQPLLGEGVWGRGAPPRKGDDYFNFVEKN